MHEKPAACIPLRSLSALSACINLERLDITHCHLLTSLEPLSSCTSLERLVMTWCDAVSSIAPLAASRIKHLEMGECERVRCLSPLSTCVALSYLDITSCNAVSSLTPLSSCAKLEYLDVSDLKLLSSLAPLSARAQHRAGAPHDVQMSRCQHSEAALGVCEAQGPRNDMVPVCEQPCTVIHVQTASTSICAGAHQSAASPRCRRATSA